MEVFMRNVPDVGEKTLSALLKPFMDRLGISEHAYDCQQPRKKNFAFLTFLYQQDGQKFLDKHGELNSGQRAPGQKALFSGRSFSTPRLTLNGAQVRCKRSNRETPNSITLRGLQEQVEKAKRMADRAAAESAAAKHAGRLLSLGSPPPPQGRLALDSPSRGGSAQRGHSADDRDDSSHSRGSSRHGPERIPTLVLLSLSCGFYQYGDKDRLLYVAETTEERGGLVKCGRKTLTIEPSDDTMVRVPLSSIQEAVWSPAGDITLTLHTVPLFFARHPEALSSPLRWSRLVARNAAHAAVVGGCRIYRLRVVPTEELGRCMRKLADLRVISVTQFGVPVSVLGGGRGASSFAGSLRHMERILRNFMAQGSLPFGILYQLQALAYNAYLHPETVLGMVWLLAQRWKTRPVSVQAMRNLFPAIDWPSPEHPDPGYFRPAALVDYLLEEENRLQSSPACGLVPPGDNQVFVHRVVVTPSCITLHGPELEYRNRVLRMYPRHPDFFLRVQFCDEDGQNMHFTSRVDNDTIYARFRQTMTDGFQIAGRHYSLLGWSHSSLRAHTVWFSAPFTDDTGSLVTALNIKLKLGDFAAIRTPARCAARIGQAFSETQWTVPLRAHGIVACEIDDVVSADGSRVFSDGVGSISLGALQVVWSVTALKTNATCLQIRYAGVKGMLALDARLFGREIRIRPSMKKFESQETANLEICAMSSKPIPLYLNRQLVKILEDMNVPRAWFQRLQKSALDELRSITSSAYNTASYLKTQCVATSIKLHKLVRLAGELAFDYRTDPFLRRAIEAVLLRELRLLKHKARMFVPCGITLFGVMDETGFLDEGEVYVALEAKRGSKSQRFRDPPRPGDRILVTRSPALHPGDIQWAYHTQPDSPDHPLRQLQNCIVFSAKGARDLPSQLSGGDLDGDIFNIIWDTAVCDCPGVQTYQAADYPRQALQDIGREVTVEDMAQFFVGFMKTDYLGAIATRHMILCDQKDKGTLDPNSILVAEMHSTAVDFSKTGIPADLKKLPGTNKFRPDFLSPGPIATVYDRQDIELDEYRKDEDPNRDDDGEASLEGPAFKFYKSEKILGELYRAVDETKIWYDVRRSARQPSTAAERAPDFYDAFIAWAREECRMLGCGNQWKKRFPQAVQVREAYEDMMINTMHDFSEHPIQPLTELEVFIGSIINRTGGQTPRQRDRSRKLRDEFERISSVAMELMRPRAAREESSQREGPVLQGGEQNRYSALELCLACVHRPPSQVRPRRRRHGITIESFWLVAASALLLEIQWVRNGLVAEEAAKAEMQQQQQQQKQQWEEKYGRETRGGVGLKPYKYGSSKRAYENRQTKQMDTLDAQVARLVLGRGAGGQ